MTYDALNLSTKGLLVTTQDKELLEKRYDALPRLSRMLQPHCSHKHPACSPSLQRLTHPPPASPPNTHKHAHKNKNKNKNNNNNNNNKMTQTCTQQQQDDDDDDDELKAGDGGGALSNKDQDKGRDAEQA